MFTLLPALLQLRKLDFSVAVLPEFINSTLQQLYTSYGIRRLAGLQPLARC